MKKQAVLYVLCLTALLLLSGCAAPEAASAYVPQSAPGESLCLSNEEMRPIAEAFSAEIAYVASAAPVQMQSLSAAELETVQGIAIQQRISPIMPCPL